MKRIQIAPIFCLATLFACENANSLTWGDADWPSAPIPEPGSDGGDGDEDADEDGEDANGGEDGLSFTPEADFQGTSECDPFAQDCPEGEKCVPYASTGGGFDANKCVQVAGAGMTGDACTYGGPVEATDDCDNATYCWDVDAMSFGTCTAFCTGTADDPICDPGTSCQISNEGSINLCIGDEEGTDTGTDTGTGTGTGETGMPDNIPDADEIAPLPSPPLAAEQACPDTTDPIVLYMSNDDSNSQASPALARRRIHEDTVISPDQIRIYEFLNYYDLSYDNPEDKAAEVGIQMRRTDKETGEFTLLLYAQGRVMRAEDRPPMNLVFTLDTSGSMGGEPMELLKDSMTALAGSLRADDTISMVRWSTDQAVLLDGHVVSGPDDPTLITAIEGLDSSGGTNLEAGLTAGYELANAHYIDGGLNRVVLISDGGANAGTTSIDLISANAADGDNEGVYLVGVGVGEASYYRDELMDSVTDAGKGAYLFIDSMEEAEYMFGERFVSNIAVAARDVRMQLTMPWYFGIKSFHGEEISSDPAEVEPQHLSPNDAMSFHQVISACDPEKVKADATITARVDYLDPETLEPQSDELTVKIGGVVQQDAGNLRKADVIVAYAKALIVIGHRWENNLQGEALEVAEAMVPWLEQAATELADPEIEEIADLMAEYVTVLGG